MMGYDNLLNYFQTNFSLIHHHKYSLSELENMIPWERIVYIDLLKAHIKQEEQAARDAAAAARRR
jgi:hypothetical protein